MALAEGIPEHKRPSFISYVFQWGAPSGIQALGGGWALPGRGKGWENEGSGKTMTPIAGN